MIAYIALAFLLAAGSAKADDCTGRRLGDCSLVTCEHLSCSIKPLDHTLVVDVVLDYCTKPIAMMANVTARYDKKSYHHTVSGSDNIDLFPGVSLDISIGLDAPKQEPEFSMKADFFGKKITLLDDDIPVTVHCGTTHRYQQV